MFSLPGRRRPTPADSPEIVPGFDRPAPTPLDVAKLHTAHRSATLDLAERQRAALDEIDAILADEQARPREMRDARLFNALLDVRHKLASGSLILPLRPSVPVTPGGGQ